MENRDMELTITLPYDPPLKQRSIWLQASLPLCSSTLSQNHPSSTSSLFFLFASFLLPMAPSHSPPTL